MAVYEYKAIAKSGKASKGVIDADSPAAARRKLREQDLHPTEIVEAGGNRRAVAGAPEAVKNGSADGKKGAFIFGRVSVRDVALMTRQFGILLQAGMPLVEALSALLTQTSKPRLQKALYDIRDFVKGGGSLGEALGRHPRIFSPLYTNMVRSGETSGALEQVLLRLADIEEQQAKLHAR